MSSMTCDRALSDADLQLEQAAVTHTDSVTHLTYRVARWAAGAAEPAGAASHSAGRNGGTGSG
jgi:hypothetical protein